MLHMRCILLSSLGMLHYDRNIPGGVDLVGVTMLSIGEYGKGYCGSLIGKDQPICVSGPWRPIFWPAPLLVAYAAGAMAYPALFYFTYTSLLLGPGGF